MRYAILGATGQLAADVSDRLNGQVLRLTRQEADLTRPDTLQRALADAKPAVVFNCAAYNFVDRAETEPAAAFAVNAFGVRDLAHVCRELDCTLVHFSTDYVFGLNSDQRHAYLESDAPGPLGVYGASKLSGEYFVRSICPKNFVIRTCGLYGLRGVGGKGDNFVEKMLRFAQAGKALKVVADQCCTPSFTADIADGAVRLVETGKFGLYHLTNSGSCSWYEFAQAIFELSGIKPDLNPTTSHEFAAGARRPPYSVLEMDACKRDGVRPPRPWKEALAAYLAARSR
jgi:dTDP-4-dehydrorhamnose reductase